MLSFHTADLQYTKIIVTTSIAVQQTQQVLIECAQRTPTKSAERI